MRALWMQCKIEILRTFRNKLFVFFSLLMPVMFYYIFTNVVQVPQNGDAWKAHYLISMATFSIVGTALFSFGVRLSQERGQGWTHLLKITPLPEGAYLTAKIIAQTVVNAFSILVIFIAGILINHVELTVGQWIGAGDIVAGKSIGWENIAVLGGYFLIFVVVSIYIRKRQEAV
ncbi:ABC transporter permease [Bacillus thuringiensis]|uniref:ABC transporter permease n=1 Tax=Bacillus thuringiensis TaxID=1428 RepID=UPI000BF679A6|nr:ABC transporter permease [Bacillus thuringiensis]PFT63512.1 hypothetical protein COK82_02120 [Bacillus thuringiensis]